MVVMDSLDDNGPTVPPPPTTEMPPLAVPVSAKTWERRRMREAAAQVPEPARVPTPVTIGTTSPRMAGALDGSTMG